MGEPSMFVGLDVEKETLAYLHPDIANCCLMRNRRKSGNCGATTELLPWPCFRRLPYGTIRSPC